LSFRHDTPALRRCHAIAIDWLIAAITDYFIDCQLHDTPFRRRHYAIERRHDDCHFRWWSPVAFIIDIIDWLITLYIRYYYWHYATYWAATLHCISWLAIGHTQLTARLADSQADAITISWRPRHCSRIEIFMSQPNILRAATILHSQLHSQPQPAVMASRRERVTAVYVVRERRSRNRIAVRVLSRELYVAEPERAVRPSF